MKHIETDFGIVPVDELYGPLRQALVERVETLWPYMPNIKSVSVAQGRIGLWGDGDVKKWIRISFEGQYDSVVD